MDPSSGAGASAATGIQALGIDPTYTLEYSCCEPQLSANLAVRFAHPDADLPWLAASPASGTVPAESSQPVTVTFDAAAVDQPGVHEALLVFSGVPDVEVPVAMTVEPPPDLGKVAGSVLDRCTGAPVAALVEIYDSGGAAVAETWTEPATGADARWLTAGSYHLRFSASGYLGRFATVAVTAGGTTTLDLDLVPDRPCAAATPRSARGVARRRHHRVPPPHRAGHRQPGRPVPELRPRRGRHHCDQASVGAGVRVQGQRAVVHCRRGGGLPDRQYHPVRSSHLGRARLARPRRLRDGRRVRRPA